MLTQAAAAGTLADADIDALVRFVTWEVLSWHHENRKAFQIAVGAEYFICDGKSIPRFQETWTSEMARAFHHFGNARFDLMMASDVLTHEVAVLARQFPNVYARGYWWHNFFPATIEKIVSLRIQMAPMTKVSGFLCDAYYAEWSYGKLQVVKKAWPPRWPGWSNRATTRKTSFPRSSSRSSTTPARPVRPRAAGVNWGRFSGPFLKQDQRDPVDTSQRGVASICLANPITVCHDENLPHDLSGPPSSTGRAADS